MKRSAVLLLSLALVLMFSFVAYGASASVSISGQIEFDAYVRQKWDPEKEEHGELEFFAQGRRWATLSFSTGNLNNGNLRLIMSFNSRKVGSDATDPEEWEPWTSDVYNPANQNYQFGLNSARLEARGALWKGGSNVTVVLGRYSPGLYSSWVAHGTRTRSTASGKYEGGSHRNTFLNSVEIRDLQVGPFTVKAVHGFSTSFSNTRQDQPTFINAQGNLGGVNADITVVNRGVHAHTSVPQADYKHVWDFAATLSAKPVDGLDLSGTVAVDGQGQGFSLTPPNVVEIEPKMAFEVNAKLTSLPNVSLSGSVFRADDGFAPRYAQWDRTWEDWRGETVGGYESFRTNRQGIKLNAETEVAGLKVTGGFTNITNVAEGTPKYKEQVINAGVSTKIEQFDVGVDVKLLNVDDEENGYSDYSKTQTVLKIGTTVSDVKLGYKGTFVTKDNTSEDAKHEIEASTTRNLFFADKVSLNGKVILKGDDLNYGVDATWKAPNDLEFTVGYANYKKSSKYAVHGPGTPDGFYIRTYTKWSF